MSERRFHAPHEHLLQQNVDLTAAVHVINEQQTEILQRLEG